MERELYLTEAPLSQTPDTTILPQKQRNNSPVKSLANPNDRRNQISKKLLSDFPPQSYYDDKKIKPGILVYKTIMQMEDKRREGQWNGPLLKINIQPTLAFTDNVNSMIFNDQGVVKALNYISYQQYLSKLNIKQEEVRNQQQIYPLFDSKCCNGIIFEHNIIMNNQLTSKILPRSENVISTLYPYPYASYPNLIRLFYTPSHMKTAKKNLGYKIINRKQLSEDSYKKKHRLANQFMVNIDNQQSYIATLMKGKSLEQCQQMAKSLCQYLQEALLIKIQQVVMDFVVAQSKVIFFSDIKSIRSKTKTKLWQIGSQEQIIKLASQNNNQIMCRLCGMLYTKQQMQKLVTNKLIYELISHLQNRGRRLTNIPHLKKDGLSNVCHLCYELIKAEHTLINVEREFSTLMNIRQNTVERVQSKETKQQQLFFYDQEEFQMLGQKTSKYKKWRLFFYVQKLKRIPEMEMPNAQNVEIAIEMKFQNQKQKFVKIVKNENYDSSRDNQINITKNFSKSLRTMNNPISLKRESSSSRNTTLRVQSAMPHRQRFKDDQKLEKCQYENIEFQNNQYGAERQTAGQDKNKSYFNDQTTCVTHSQSYFSTTINDKSRIQNSNNTTLHHKLTNQKANYLNSLSEDPGQDSYINGLGNNLSLGYEKHLSTVIRQQSNQNLLSLSCMPSSSKIDKVKMFIFYTKAHQNQGKNILNDEELQFTLTFTEHNPHQSYNKQPVQFKYTGMSSTLKCLKNKQTCQRHSLQIYLFDQGMKYCNLQLTVGMVCDGVFQDQGLDLQKSNNLFWGKTYSCEPLPDQWMQVFTYGQEVPKSNVDTVLQYLEQNNFSTSPPKQLQKSNSVNYLKSFQQFASKTNNEFNLRNISNISHSTNFESHTKISKISYQPSSPSPFASAQRPLSGINSSQSTSSLLKKSSLIRCKTAINRNTSSYSNLLKTQKLNQPSNRNNISSQRNRYGQGFNMQQMANQQDEDDQNSNMFGV